MSCGTISIRGEQKKFFFLKKKKKDLVGACSAASAGCQIVISCVLTFASLAGIAHGICGGHITAAGFVLAVGALAAGFAARLTSPVLAPPM